MKVIHLDKGQSTKVDDEDYEELIKYSWHAHWCKGTGTFYVYGGIYIDGKRKSVQMHRFILKSKKNDVVDHKNHDTLDNQKSNIYNATHQKNQRNKRIAKNNTSGFAGVCWHKFNKKWHAYIKVNRKNIRLGYYDNKEDAVKARKEGEVKYWGLKINQ